MLALAPDVAAIEDRRAAPKLSSVRGGLHRIGVGLAGTAVVVVGLVLVPLPGPGWAIVYAGLALLGTEFHWARVVSTAVLRLVQPAVSRARSAPRPARAALGIAVLLAAAGPAVLLAW